MTPAEMVDMLRLKKEVGSAFDTDDVSLLVDFCIAEPIETLRQVFMKAEGVGAGKRPGPGSGSDMETDVDTQTTSFLERQFGSRKNK